ncbi:PepSY domain-containing protein [uncultured Shewanella sp.]|uniref:PepSY domain-containing protein n=1 Tax=Shewanella atlantica TaxID=271099 RepID=UPI002635156C|nr:PepSY domain-containing protein [uncultured Shewanella sp.]
MARWLVGLVLFSSTGFSAACLAETSVLQLLSDEQNISPQMIMLQVEKAYPGVISEFEIDVEKGELIYEVSVIDTNAETITEFEFRAKDGRLIHQQVESLETDDKDELKAVSMMEDKSLTFSNLVKQAMSDSQAHIVEAQLDHDLNISYLELKLIDEDGKSKLAFDIKTERPLPMLKWN